MRLGRRRELAGEREPGERREGVREDARPVPATREREPEGEPVGARGSEPVGRREAAPARRRAGLGWRSRDAGAAAVGSAGAGVLLLARLVMVVASLIALLIALAIVLRDVDANSANTIVEGIHEGANFFAGSFTGLIKFTGHAKRAITVNWGIALVAYLIVGAIVSNLIAGVGRGGVRFERRHRAAPTH